GCSADEVNDAVLHRYAEATRVAEQIADRALVRLLAASDQTAVAVNPTGRERSATVAAVIPGDVPPPDTQQLTVRPSRTRTDSLDPAAAVAVVTRAALEDPRVSSVELEAATDGSGDWIATVVADHRPKDIDQTALRDRLDAIASDPSVRFVHLEVQRLEATQEVLLRTAPIPGFGWRGLAPADLGDHAVRPHGGGLTNGLVTVEVDQSDGTFSLDGIVGYGRLVDDGDAGDTYNWSPPPGDQVVSRPVDVDVLVAEAGPVRGRIEIRRTYRWPEAVVDDHRVGEVEVVVLTVVEVHACEDLVRVSVSFDNRSRDHRLRVLLPLPERSDRSAAECAFAVVERGLDAEGGPNEAGLPTFPSRRFVEAGGLLVVHDGLCEYELVDVEGEGEQRGAGALALTLIRSVGLISNGPMAMRALPAGPPLPTPAAQMPGLHEARFVLHRGGRDPYAVADESFTPIRTARRPGGFGDSSSSGQGLDVKGAEVTALRRGRDGRLELRVLNSSGDRRTFSVTGRTGRFVDLAGEPTGEIFQGSAELGPWKIATLQLD
ncbi:MAG: hypothetical protein KDB02_06210, partial [Acidimicrobiales bacterium]|nr:hypothetical protein [Acidimicrobiales bacterium]